MSERYTERKILYCTCGHIMREHQADWMLWFSYSKCYKCMCSQYCKIGEQRLTKRQKIMSHLFILGGFAFLTYLVVIFK